MSEPTTPAAPERSGRASGTAAFRFGLRLGLRELRRSPWRATLVVVMVLLPTAAMAGGTMLLRTSEWSKADALSAAFGTADLEGQRSKPGPAGSNTSIPVPISDAEVAELRAALPDDTLVVRERQVYDRMAQGDRRAYVQLSDLPLDSRIVDGRFRWLAGERATEPDHVVLTRSAAADLDVGVGDSITASRLHRTLEVVGLVDPVTGHGDAGYVVGALDGPQAVDHVLIDLPADAERALTSNRPPLTVPGWGLSPAMTTGRSQSIGVFWTYLAGGMALIVLSTVIAAAFAVGARRQLRTIGLLSSCGAPPRAVTWSLVAQGSITGLIGSVLGVLASIVVVRALPEELLTSIASRSVGAPVIRVADLVPVVVIGVAVASVAAWVPARTASRVPTLQALAGRRPLAAVPRRLPALGVVSLAAGCGLLATAVAGTRQSSSSGWAFIGLVGGLGLLGGVLAASPWFVGLLGRRVGWWPESWRLAARSLARSRVRSSAVVAAIATVAAGVIGGSTLATSLDDHGGDSLPHLRAGQVSIESLEVRALPPELIDPFSDPSDPYSKVASYPVPIPAEIRSRILAEVPDATLVTLGVATPEDASSDAPSYGVSFEYVTPSPAEGAPDLDVGFPMGMGLAIATPPLLDLLQVPGELRDQLADGKAISVVRPPDGASAIRIDTTHVDGTPREGREVPFGGGRLTDGAAQVLPTVLISPATAASLDLEERPGSSTIVTVGHDLTAAEHRRLALLAGDIGWEHQAEEPSVVGSRQVWVNVPGEPSRFSEGQIKAMALGAALLIVLMVVGIGLALAARDSEDERQVLSSVGASPRILRRVGASRAVLLGALAAVVAVPTGLLPAAAITAAATSDPYDDRHLRPDLLSVALVVVAMPLIAGAATALVGVVRDKVRPARPDQLQLID